MSYMSPVVSQFSDGLIDLNHQSTTPHTLVAGDPYEHHLQAMQMRWLKNKTHIIAYESSVRYDAGEGFSLDFVFNVYSDVLDESCVYGQQSATSCNIFANDYYLRLNSYNGLTHVRAFGTEQAIEKIRRATEAGFDKKAVNIKWVHNARGDEVELPLTETKIIRSAYPFIQGDIDDYIKRYRDWETDRKSTRLNSSH